MTEKVKFGAEFKRLRNQSGKTLAHVAKHLGTSSSYISDIEKGKRDVNSHKKAETLLSSLNLCDIDITLAMEVAVADYQCRMWERWGRK